MKLSDKHIQFFKGLQEEDPRFTETGIGNRVSKELMLKGYITGKYTGQYSFMKKWTLTDRGLKYLEGL